jgi:site-specific recombinase XerD
MKRRKTKKRRPQTMENNWLTPDELLRLLKAARNRSMRDWALLLVGYRHALRAQELSNLTLSDVDLKTKSIRVRRVKGSLETVQPLEKRAGQPLLDEPKALRLWLAERKDDSNFVFTSQKGGALTTNAIWRLFATIAADAGIEGRSVHALKHSRVSHLLSGGSPISEVRMSAGHRALSSTLRYVHATDESAAKAARQAEASIF